MMTSHHWFWKWLVVFRQQVTWGRVLQDLSPHMASPWSNELNQWGLGTPYDTWFCSGHHDTRSNYMACPATPIWHFVHPQKRNVTKRRYVILTHWSLGFRWNFTAIFKLNSLIWCLINPSGRAPALTLACYASDSATQGGVSVWCMS